jgi:hypothetical protein
MAVVHRLAGLDGLLVVTVTLIALLFASVAGRIDRSGMNKALGSLILFLALAASSHHFHVRPHIVTIFFMTIVYSRLCDIEAGRKNISTLFCLLPIFIIWSNMHGGVLGGLFTLLIAAAGWTLICRKGWGSYLQNEKALIKLWAITLLCFTAPFVNPYGLKLPLTWLDIMSSSAVSELIQEHASVLTLLRFGETASFITITLLFSLGLFYTALLAGTDRNERRVTWYIPLVWFFLSLSRIRHAPLFAMMALVSVVEIFPYCRWVRNLGDRGLSSFRISKVSLEVRVGSISRYLLPVVMTGIALLAFHGSAQLPSTTQKWVTLDGAHWPIEILPELLAIEKELPKASPIFNDMLFGGFLIYHAPGFRVFIDDRCELYGDDFMLRYVRAERSDIEAWTKAYGYELALLLPDSNYGKYFEDNPDWRVVKRCRAAVLYQKCNMLNTSARRIGTKNAIPENNSL